jgi:hypothetical protein
MTRFLKDHFHVIAIIYALFAMAIFPRWTIDDAYILCRYADNFAHHGELTYNIGEETVEGYTGVAWPVLLALFIKLGISPIASGKILGILAYFFSGWVLHRILKRIAITGFARSLVIFIYFTSAMYFSIAWAGLETMLFLAAIMISTWLLFVQLGDSPPSIARTHWFFLSLLFVSLVRPEGVLLAGIYFLTAVYRIAKHRRDELRSFALRFCGIYLLPAIAYFAWRLNYYGLLLPNPYYVKSSGGMINKGTVLILLI